MSGVAEEILYYTAVRIGATWQIRLNDYARRLSCLPLGGSTRPVAKLLHVILLQ